VTLYHHPLLTLLLLIVATAAVPPSLRSEPLQPHPEGKAEMLELSERCPQAIFNLVNSIASVGAGTPGQLINWLPGDIHNPYLPYNSALIIVLSTGDTPGISSRVRRSVDLMHSPVLQARMSSNVFQGCPEIVKVTFTLEKTDWSTSFFRGEGNVAIPARCLDPGPNTGKLKWGEEICF